MTKVFFSLIQDMQQGNHHVFKEFLEYAAGLIQARAWEYHRKYRYAFSHIDEAEILALEAVYDFVRTYDVSRNDTDIKEALSRHIHNMLERERKHIKADMDRHEKDFIHAEGIVSDLPEYLEDTTHPRPEGHVLKMDLRERLEDYLRLLTPIERQVIHLQYAEGMTYEQISRTCRKSRYTVARISQRSLRKLRKAMGESKEWCVAA